MIALDDENIDQILQEFSSDELINLSDDLLGVAMEITLQDDLDISEIESIAKGNDLLVLIPKIIASRLNKAELYSRKFIELDTEDLIFVGYSISELRNIRKLLEDIVSLIELRSQDDLNILYHEVFEELKDSFEMDPSFYRKALHNVNEAYRIQSRHIMNQAIAVYKQIASADIEYLLDKSVPVLEEYRHQLDQAIELLEASTLNSQFAEQLEALRKTLILVLELLNTNTVGSGFAGKRISYIQNILYHIRHAPQEYIHEVLRRFAEFSQDMTIHEYMKPEEIAIRYKTRYIKHNRVLLSFISNSIDISDDTTLEITNTILKNLSMALNIKLQFVRTQALCSKLLETDPEVSLCTYSQTKLNELYGRLTNVNEILESYPVHSKYLEELQEYCYKALIAILKCFGNEYLLELADIFRRYQTYAARKLFTLRISILCRYIYIQTEEELAAITSIKIMTVCRGLIEYQYHFLKPKSGLLDTEFDLEWYREPVLQKIESTIRYMQSEQANRTTQEKFTKSLFSQLVIDSLALKVQELDDSTRKIREDKIVSVPELQGRIKSAQERIRYFLKQHDEESQSGYIKFSESVAPE